MHYSDQYRYDQKVLFSYSFDNFEHDLVASQRIHLD